MQIREQRESEASSTAKDQSSECDAGTHGIAFDDLRSQVLVQRRYNEVAGTSSRVDRLRLAAKVLQRKSATDRAEPNRTGLPDRLKAGIETLSGLGMDVVRVHYNSVKPAQLQAHAYAQGTEIHLAPGQERHLPHEAWHVVQQMQGRVRPTAQLKGRTDMNDDPGLEAEADAMGARASNMQVAVAADEEVKPQSRLAPHASALQRKGRVELSALEGHPQSDEIIELVKKARLARIEAKMQARLKWLPMDDPDGNNASIEDRDTQYNNAVEVARKNYGVEMLRIKATFALTPQQFKDGEAYYGTHVGNGVWKRTDGKEFVRGSNGIFMPRYARRELNKYDLKKTSASKSLTHTGVKNHGTRGLGDKTKKGQALDANDREFLQQSRGGGKNQFAFSLTATKHPILSNDHVNFGAQGRMPDNTPHGRVIVDLQKIEADARRAQWKLAPEEDGGHKIKRTDFLEKWMEKRRNKVIASGYRNMEVITNEIPFGAIVDNESGWEAEDGSGEAKSAAGQWLHDFRKDKEKPDSAT